MVGFRSIILLFLFSIFSVFFCHFSYCLPSFDKLGSFLIAFYPFFRFFTYGSCRNKEKVLHFLPRDLSSAAWASFWQSWKTALSVSTAALHRPLTLVQPYLLSFHQCICSQTYHILKENLKSSCNFLIPFHLPLINSPDIPGTFEFWFVTLMTFKIK